MTKTISRWLCGLACCLMFADVEAHAIGLSRGEYRVTATGVSVELVFARPELAETLPEIDADFDGAISVSELAQQRAALQDALSAGVRIRADADVCSGSLLDAALTGNDGVQIRLDYRCAAPSQNYALSLSLLEALSPGHRHLANWPRNGVASTHVLHLAQPTLSIAAAAPAQVATTGWPMLRFGMHHILTGYDHLVFLLGLLIVAPTLRDLLVVVTAFTLGHSVTLGLATLGVWAPSPSLVEPLIALSIVYVGVENFVAARARRRWPLTLGFGLIHGFGFAGVLTEVELPPAEIPMALLSFNGGVELGQLLVLAFALPVVRLLRRFEWFAQHGVRSLSAAIALAGLGWFIERVL
jgi:hydrogenase/urease accessory protein HupE